MTGETPTDYTKEDGSGENGMEQCPHCEKQFSGEGGHHGTVYDQQGREYEYFLNTDPAKGPFFCPECWPELENNRRAEENQTLGEYQ